MKLFFRTVLYVFLATAIFCCGCADRRAGDSAQPDRVGAEGGRGEGGAGQNAPGPWQYADTAMGTVVQQTVYAADRETAQDFSDRAMALLWGLEGELISWRVEDSEVYRANASAGSGEGFLLSEELGELLEDCLILSERSEGAFDVTLGAVTRLWDIDKWAAEGSREGFQVPSKEMLDLALGTCGSHRLRLVREAAAPDIGSKAGGGPGEGRPEGEEPDAADLPAQGEAGQQGRQRLFLPEGMQLDLGAVGKGLAMAKLHALLEGCPSVTGAVISLGGGILTYGSKPDGSAWKVGIVDPFDRAAYIGVLSLEGEWCISTSGDYERYVEVDGVRYHHILDPKTGAPARGDVRSATILSGDGLLSDGLSTACFILGPEKGMALAAEYGAEVLFVMADGEILMSEGMGKHFTER